MLQCVSVDQRPKDVAHLFCRLCSVVQMELRRHLEAFILFLNDKNLKEI